MGEPKFHTDAGHRMSTDPDECELCKRDRKPRVPRWRERLTNRDETARVRE